MDQRPAQIAMQWSPGFNCRAVCHAAVASPVFPKMQPQVTKQVMSSCVGSILPDGRLQHANRGRPVGKDVLECGPRGARIVLRAAATGLFLGTAAIVKNQRMLLGAQRLRLGLLLIHLRIGASSSRLASSQPPSFR